MNYTFWQLSAFFFLYSIMCWIGLTFCISLYKGHFINVGILNGPMLPAGGITMTLCVWLVRDKVANYFGQFLLCTVVCLFVHSIASHMKENATGILVTGILSEVLSPMARGKELIHMLLYGEICLGTICLIHPFTVMLISLIPGLILKIILWVLYGLLLIDLTASGLVLRRFRNEKNRLQTEIARELDRTSSVWGKKIENRIRRRLYKAYPEMEASAAQIGGFGEPDRRRVFAGGYGIVKMFWVFVLCALGGDLVETVYCRLTAGVWMSRSSFLYGPFSVVWGGGAALGIALLAPLAKKNDRWLFLGGFFLGGSYEYLCSVFTEIVFGKVFWDYSDFPLNIDGRTNVLFMFFWGIAALVLVKCIYPYLNRWIEKIPPLPGMFLTWAAVVVLVLDILVSGLAISRYSLRPLRPEPETTIERYLDTHFPDIYVEKRWPNMKTAKS